MNIDIVKVRIGGGLESVAALLAGLPGSHIPEDLGNDRYSVATTNPDFLRFAIERQGYGEVIE
jgi:hypothetical protein